MGDPVTTAKVQRTPLNSTTLLVWCSTRPEMFISRTNRIIEFEKSLRAAPSVRLQELESLDSAVTAGPHSMHNKITPSIWPWTRPGISTSRIIPTIEYVKCRPTVRLRPLQEAPPIAKEVLGERAVRQRLPNPLPPPVSQSTLQE